MKRVFLIVVVFLFVGVVGAFAQKFSNESEYYPKTLPIARIYNHSKGYRIDFIRQDYSVGTLWAPTDWFRGAGSTGAIAYGANPSYPYVTFFYLNGEIDHFRLYLYENPAHQSWGSLDPNVDYSDRFPDPDSKPVVNFE